MTTIIATAHVPTTNRLNMADTVTLPPLADQPCPDWCTHHYTDEDDGAAMHTSESVITRTIVCRETHDIGVELYRLDLPAEPDEDEVGADGKPSIHIEGAGQADMTPAQALQLAAVLIEHAHRALGDDAQPFHTEDGATALGFEYGRRYERTVLQLDQPATG